MHPSEVLGVIRYPSRDDRPSACVPLVPSQTESEDDSVLRKGWLLPVTAGLPGAKGQDNDFGLLLSPMLPGRSPQGDRSMWRSPSGQDS